MESEPEACRKLPFLAATLSQIHFNDVALLAVHQTAPDSASLASKQLVANSGMLTNLELQHTRTMRSIIHRLVARKRPMGKSTLQFHILFLVVHPLINDALQAATLASLLLTLYKRYIFETTSNHILGAPLALARPVPLPFASRGVVLYVFCPYITGFVLPTINALKRPALVLTSPS